MAKSNLAVQPQTIVTPVPAVTTAAVANANGDAPTNTVQLGTVSPAEGDEIYDLKVIPRASMSATVLYLWQSNDAGATKRLIRAVLAAAQTVSTTSAAVPVDFGFTKDKPLRLASGVTLWVGQSVALADGFVWRREGASYTA